MKNIILVVLLLIVNNKVFSQELTETEKTQLKQFAVNEQKIKIKTFEQNNFTPFGSSAFSNFISNISVSSTYNKGENGKAELKYTSKNWLTTGITVDQKLGKNDKEATPLDLFDGISPGTTVEFNLQKMFWDPLLNRIQFNKFDQAAIAYAARKNVARNTVTYNQIIADGNTAEIATLKSVKLKQPIFFNIKASFTKTSYTYTTDSFSLEKINQNYITPSVSLFVGIPFSDKSFLAFSYNYSETYQASDEVSFISPFGTSNNQISQDLSFGAPQKKTDNKLNAELRMSISNGAHPSSISIGPSLTWGLTSNKIAFYLPVYFLNGKTTDGKVTGLQGGLRLRYLTSTERGQSSSFKDAFGAQVFISAPFDIFGNL